MITILLLLLLLAAAPATPATVSFKGTPDDPSAGAANTALLNQLFSKLQPNDVLVIENKTFFVAGGVRAANLINTTIVLDGTLKFLPGRSKWPVQDCAKGGNPLQPKKNGTCVQECIFFANMTGLKLTSSGEGTLHGNGQSWWGYIKYLVYKENRPRLFSIVNATDILVERWNFLQSPYWTFTAYDVADMEISHCNIDNRVNGDDSHDISNLDAFNTDGFDFAGRNIHIHDVNVWNQDDCATVQPIGKSGFNAQCTENILIERINASGLGLTVGAVHPSRDHNCVRNVTFRDARMHHTFKGIYVKSGSSFDPEASGEISNILYENIVMDAPTQVPIWIGPAQEADSKGACSLLWPTIPFSKCPPPPLNMLMANITLRNVNITSPKQSPGVVLGNAKRPMKGIVFDSVVVTNPGKSPWGDKFYHCEGVEGAAAVHGTSPVPPCF